jgi:hypothetical protein
LFPHLMHHLPSHWPVCGCCTCYWLLPNYDVGTSPGVCLELLEDSEFPFAASPNHVDQPCSMSALVDHVDHAPCMVHAHASSSASGPELADRIMCSPPRYGHGPARAAQACSVGPPLSRPTSPRPHLDTSILHHYFIS